jgi:outer membrane biosynthesis protein TonB
MKILYTLLVASALASGCVRTAAKTAPNAPPLDMPAAPPRDVEPSDVEAPPPVPLMTEPARNTPPRSRQQQPARDAQPRVEPPKVEPPKPEPPPVEPTKPIEEAPKPPATTSTLQTTPATAEGEVERGIRASLARANADLNHIDYRVLNADARTQYDTAKRFIRQADEAIRTKNLVFAKNLADKAAALAAQLGGR